MRGGDDVPHLDLARMGSPSRAYSYSGFPFIFRAECSDGICLYLPRKLASASSTLVCVTMATTTAGCVDSEVNYSLARKYGV